MFKGWKDRRREKAKDRASRARVKDINRQRSEAAAKARFDRQQERSARLQDQPLGGAARFSIPGHPIHSNEVKLFNTFAANVPPGFTVDAGKTFAAVRTKFENESTVSDEWTARSGSIGPIEWGGGSSRVDSKVNMTLTHVGTAQVVARHGQWEQNVTYTEAERRTRCGVQHRSTRHAKFGPFSVYTDEMTGNMTETSVYTTSYKGSISTDGNKAGGAVLDGLEGSFVQIK